MRLSLPGPNVEAPAESEKSFTSEKSEYFCWLISREQSFEVNIKGSPGERELTTDYQNNFLSDPVSSPNWNLESPQAARRDSVN